MHTKTTIEKKDNFWNSYNSNTDQIPCWERNEVEEKLNFSYAAHRE
jgi:ADP-dependent phosphofructokinase/glucokinase